MKQVFKIGLLVLWSSWFFYFSKCTSPRGISSNTDLVLFDFEENFDVELVHPQSASFKLVGDQGNRKLHITNGTEHKEPGVVLKEPKDRPWNLKGYHQVKADVTNIGDEKIQVEMFVGNDPDGLIRWYCSDYVDLKPSERKTITVNLSWTPWVHQPQLDIKGMRGAPGKIKTDLEAIDEITFCSRYAYTENDFLIDNVRAVGAIEVRDTNGFFPFTDEFGQYKHDDWKGKIHTATDLQAAIDKEQKDIDTHPSPPNRNQYLGWTGGPQLEATGWFRTERYDDKWWIVDPEGRLFWTTGLNCMASGVGLSGIEGRMRYFENLPAKDSPLAQFYDKGRWASHGFYQDKIPFDAYQFYQSNLYKKYGEDWLTTFRENTHKRIKSWGFNTIGFVSDDGATQMQQTPYVGSIWIQETPKIEGSAGFWGKFHDVFDPAFRLAVRSSMERQKQGAGDPWCLGYFVDNELSWGKAGSIAAGALRSPATQAAKVELVEDLRKKYRKVEALNQSWRTKYGSWEEILQSTTVPEGQNVEEDLLIFYDKIANTYFRTIKEELSRIAPNQMYIGCRFAWANNDITLRAAAKYCDIVSFNKYEYSVENVSLPEGVDKPIMIGEFHFGALDRGKFHVGVKAAKSQEHRGELYQKYIQGALRNPAIVGAHWFQYVDEATTGREDGENYNVGFIDICDTPYEELIQKARETTYTLYEYRMEHDL
ncbi:MAG: beta-galactosidase [Bacteroidota bacterium]